MRRATGATQTVSGRCLIAADGIRSTTRRKLYPQEGKPLYAGRILWRAFANGAPFLNHRTMIMAGYPDQKFVCYPSTPQLTAQGCAVINWIAERSVPDWTPCRGAASLNNMPERSIKIPASTNHGKGVGSAFAGINDLARRIIGTHVDVGIDWEKLPTKFQFTDLYYDCIICLSRACRKSKMNYRLERDRMYREALSKCANLSKCAV